MMENNAFSGVVIVNKPVGPTSVRSLDLLREQFPEFRNLPLCIAGRLDPMAEGVLPVLVGEARFQAKEYYQHDKVYEFQLALGLSSDTFDALGVIERGSNTLVQQAEVGRVLKLFFGDHSHPYPPYSSRTINGKPLFQYAREGKLESVTLPAPARRIYSGDILAMRSVSLQEIVSRMRRRITLVAGDFRQDRAVQSWENLLSETPNEQLQVVRIRLYTGPGVYIRGLTQSIGQLLGTKAITLTIQRTQVSHWNLENAYHLARDPDIFWEIT